MTPTQIALVQESFAKVAPLGKAVSDLFYGRLFQIDASLRPLFNGDMNEQGRKLLTMLSVVVNGLTRLEALVPQVQALGRRHAGYGVEPGHYDTVGAALLDTLEKGLGDDFTPETRDAWTAAYTLLAGTMQAASEAEAT